MEEKYVHGSICCNNSFPFRYEVFETDHKFELQWWGGYTRHNKIWRNIISESEEEIKTELVTENHAVMMYNPLLQNT